MSRATCGRQQIAASQRAGPATGQPIALPGIDFLDYNPGPAGSPRARNR